MKSWPPNTLLGSLPAGTAKALLDARAPRWFRPGHVIVREGDPGSYVVVFLSGFAKVTTSAGGHIIVDEAQDLYAAHWTLLRALVAKQPDDLFIVGDTFQRIYDNRVNLSRLGIDIRGRGRRLTLNYRTTRQILAASLALIGNDDYDDLEGGSEQLGGYRSVLRGAAPEIAGYPSRAAELKALATRVREWNTGGIPLDEIAVLARTNPAASAAVEALHEAGLDASLVRSGQVPTPGAGVQAMTMHRAKGLEFRAVAIVCADATQVPLAHAVTPETADRIAHRHDLQRERSLLFVSATRARDALAISWSGSPSPFLERLWR